MVSREAHGVTFLSARLTERDDKLAGVLVHRLDAYEVYEQPLPARIENNRLVSRTQWGAAIGGVGGDMSP